MQEEILKERLIGHMHDIAVISFVHVAMAA